MTIHQNLRGRTTRAAGRRPASAAVVVALLALTLAACTPDDAPGVASADGGKGQTAPTEGGTSSEDLTDAERDDLARKFAGCMRDNGVDMPDPDADGGLAVTSGAVEAGTADEMDEAFEACKEFLPDGGEPVRTSPEDLEAQRAFAKCMRDQGMDMPDPDPNGGMTAAGDVGDDLEAFEAALEACNEPGSPAGLSIGSGTPAGDE